MELVARVHLRLRAGILSPTKGALEARAVAAGGGLVDDPVPPDPLACGLTRCSLNPRYMMDGRSAPAIALYLYIPIAVQRCAVVESQRSHFVL